MRALEQIDSPFLTSSGPGYIARTNNGFPEVRAILDEDVAAPLYLWGIFVTATATGIANSRPGKRGKFLVQDIIPHTDGAVPFSDAAAWVGDRRIIFMRGNQPTYIPTTEGWPILANPTDAREVEPTSPLAATRSVSYSNAAPGAYAVTAFFVTGWGGDATRYRWGYSRMAASLGNLTPVVASTGYVVLGDTALTAPHTVALPNEAGRALYGGITFCTGPGCLVSFFFVAEGVNPSGPPTYLPQVDPFYCSSSDHGDTWKRHTFSALVPFLTSSTLDTPGIIPKPRDGYSNYQLIGITTSIHVSYIGAGKSIVVVGNLVNAPTDTLLPGGKVKCFIYDSTSQSMALLASPISSAFSGFEVGVFGNLRECVSMCFGTGCFAFGEIPNKVHSTRDFGASWTTTTLTGIPPSRITVISPYVSVDKPGKILITKKNLGGAAGSTVYQTSGLFTSARALGVVFGAAGVIDQMGAYQVSYNIKGRPRNKVRVELPNEFNKP